MTADKKAVFLLSVLALILIFSNSAAQKVGTLSANILYAAQSFLISIGAAFGF